MKYIINYEALVYNMPECIDFEFLDHKFIANPLTTEDEKSIMPNNDILKTNFMFQSCCTKYADGHTSYITAKNNKPLTIDCDNPSDLELHDKAIETVLKQTDAVEQHLILTTNLHIFLPVIKINVRSEDGNRTLLCGHINNRPMPINKWNWIVEKINIELRMQLHIDKLSFDKFRFQKCCTRFNRAFDYYIRAFYELDHSSAFCILCSALDAITGRNNASDTKERLAKYSSVLFCTPLKIEQYKERMKYLYKIRSTFIHGKGNVITVQDEIELREYVRKFLIAYYFFWQEMKIKNEPQMLQKLDEILADQSKYITYASASYEMVRLLEENEVQPGGILGKSMLEKYAFVVTNMIEAFVKPAVSPSEEKNKLE